MTVNSPAGAIRAPHVVRTIIGSTQAHWAYMVVGDGLHKMQDTPNLMGSLLGSTK